MHQYEILSNKNHAIRRSNRQSFVRTIVGEKWTEQVNVLILCYNNTEQLFALLDRLDKEPRRKDFMVTIVQNSDNEEAKKNFDEKISQYENITIIYPIANLGSDGGHAMGQEYSLLKWYSHMILIEDDIELLEDDTISHTLDNISHKDEIIFIHAPINADWVHSRYVQYGCYPTSLFPKTGVVDPRTYFRSGDLEWWKRVERAIRTYWYTKKIVARNYFHPYLKWVNNSWSWIYFSLRNQLWTIRKHREGVMQFLAVVTQYRAFGFLVFLRSGKWLIIACVSKALKDGLGRHKKLEHHAEMISYLNRFKKIQIEDLWFRSTEVGFEVIWSWVRLSHIIARTTLAGPDRAHLAEHPWKIIVSWGFQPVWGTVASCMKKLLVIESLRRDKKQLEGKIIEQTIPSLVVNILLFLPCVLLWLAASLLTGLYLLRIRFTTR